MNSKSCKGTPVTYRGVVSELARSVVTKLPRVNPGNVSEGLGEWCNSLRDPSLAPAPSASLRNCISFLLVNTKIVTRSSMLPTRPLGLASTDSLRQASKVRSLTSVRRGHCLLTPYINHSSKWILIDVEPESTLHTGGLSLLGQHRDR
ncbi:hypothetical protein J6590_010301 [Homalodisca vitripennis]|nr:hypothetical protein J6590_010301 [Homalodisca vitripennis]